MKRIIAIVLAVLLLSGCRLAREEKREDSMGDRLVGVFVTFDHLNLEFDMEGYLSDNPGALEEEIVLDPADSMAYAQRLPVTATDEGWVVPGYQGLSFGRIQKADYTTTISSEGVCELNSHVTVGDDGDHVEVEGTIYFPRESEVMLCANPVYVTEAGEYYVIPGNVFQSSLEGGSMSQSVSDERTWSMDGVQTGYSAKFTATVQGVSVAERVVLVWMSADHREQKREEYIPGALPEAIEADCAYLILEEHAGETVTRKLAQPGDETISVYYQGAQPWCIPDYAELHWPE